MRVPSPLPWIPRGRSTDGGLTQPSSNDGDDGDDAGARTNLWAVVGRGHHQRPTIAAKTSSPLACFLPQPPRPPARRLTAVRYGRRPLRRRIGWMGGERGTQKSRRLPAGSGPPTERRTKARARRFVTLCAASVTREPAFLPFASALQRAQHPSNRGRAFDMPRKRRLCVDFAFC